MRVVDAKMCRAPSTERAACSGTPCSAAAPTDQTSMVERLDWSCRGSPTRIQRTPTWEGSRRSKRILGCSRIGMPPKASSNAIETKEEQDVVVRKAKIKRKKGKTMNGKCI